MPEGFLEDCCVGEFLGRRFVEVCLVEGLLCWRISGERFVEICCVGEFLEGICEGLLYWRISGGRFVEVCSVGEFLEGICGGLLYWRISGVRFVEVCCIGEFLGRFVEVICCVGFIMTETLLGELLGSDTLSDGELGG